MIIQWLIILFSIYVIAKVFVRYKKNDITGREFFIWLIFWLLVATAALMPQKTDVIAQKIGVERGADLLIYISVIVLFFALLKVVIKLKRIDRETTRLVRELSLRKKKDE